MAIIKHNHTAVILLNLIAINVMSYSGTRRIVQTDFLRKVDVHNVTSRV